MAEVYNLNQLKTPVIYGPILVLVTWIAEWIPGVARLIGKDSGLFDLRTEDLSDEVPTYYPFDVLTFLHSKQKGQAKESVMETLQQKTPERFFRSSLELHQKYKNGLSPVVICMKIIKEIERDAEEPKGCHAMLKYDQDDIMRQARLSEERYRKGKPIGPLDGIPIAVKDEMDARPYTTSVGTKHLNLDADEDAIIVQRLRSQGAIIIGKTNMHEFGLDVTNCNPNNGTPRNAYNVNHWTGGSSGGSAAAVASGLCPIAIGADGGGSIRIPASFNGVYGLKVTHDRIPGLGSFPLAPSVGVVGPIASNAYDLALSYYFSAGPSDDLPRSIQQPPVTLESFSKIESLKGVRLGVFWPYFEDAHPDIVRACKQHLEHMKQLGAEIVEIDIPFLQQMRNSHTISITSEFFSGIKHLKRSHLSYPTRTAMQVFGSIQAQDLIAAAKIRTKGMRILRELYKKVDAIVTPTTGLTAQRIVEGGLKYGLSDYTTSGQVMKFIFMANGLGVPAVTCPVGYDQNGLPIGIQFQSKWWNEDLLLRLAHVSEHIFGKETKQPEVYLDLLK
jgi:Asp-tRNA(Asn)/Glu-tRNA(Gln) amidotransferase A subunit family amidase